MNHLFPFPPDSWFYGSKGFTDVFSLSLHPPPGHSKFFAETEVAFATWLCLVFCSTRKTDNKEGVRVIMSASMWPWVSPQGKENLLLVDTLPSASVPPFLLCIISPIFIHHLFIPLMIHMITETIISFLRTGMGSEFSKPNRLIPLALWY